MKKLRITVDGKVYDVEVEILQEDDNQILPSYYQQAPSGIPSSNVQPRSSSVPVAAPQRKPINKVNNSNSNEITSPINGVVIEVKVKVGDTVNENDTVIVLEAMKMKTNISSPTSGEVASIEVRQGDTIEAGDVLVTFKQG